MNNAWDSAARLKPAQENTFRQLIRDNLAAMGAGNESLTIEGDYTKDRSPMASIDSRQNLPDIQGKNDLMVRNSHVLAI